MRDDVTDETRSQARIANFRAGIAAATPEQLAAWIGLIERHMSSLETGEVLGGLLDWEELELAALRQIRKNIEGTPNNE